jgi:DNA-binding MarR family transcriptional regulator
MRDATTPPPAGLPLSERLTFRLKVLAWDMSHAIWRLYGPRHGLSVAEWRVMAVVGEVGTAATRDVCAVTRMHKARASRILARLAERGLLERAARAVADRRTAPYRLSGAGIAVHCEIAAAAEAWEEALLARLPPLVRLGAEQAVAALEEAVRAQRAAAGPAEAEAAAEDTD